MSEKLYEEYLAFLAQYNLEPRSIPSDFAAIQEKTFKHMMAQLKASGETFIEDIYQKTYDKNKEKYLKETRHPSVIIIEKTASEVEQMIQSINNYKNLFRDEVFVGEFPTGSINAQVVKADGGFLVLINSGLMISITQVVEFLVSGDRNDPKNKVANRITIDGVIDVLHAYLRHGDPFFGPKPMSAGLTRLIAHILGRACLAYVVAHEYGHVIARHFDRQALPIEQLESDVGKINVIKKEWMQELEADTIAHKIILGIEDYAQLDLTIVDDAESSDDMSLITRACELKAAIAAPFIFLTIDSILADVQGKVRVALNKKHLDSTHPPAGDRMDNLMSNINEFDNKYIEFLNFAGILWSNVDEVEERLVRAMLENPDR